MADYEDYGRRPNGETPLMKVKAGDQAPDFELDSHRGGKVRLSDFRGKRRVVLAFHPFAWTPN